MEEETNKENENLNEEITNNNITLEEKIENDTIKIENEMLEELSNGKEEGEIE